MQDNIDQNNRTSGECPVTEAKDIQQGGVNSAEVSSDARNMALLCHLLGLLTNIVGPLIVWLIKKDDDEFIDNQGKEAVNFQITLILGYMLSGILMVVLIGVLMFVVLSVMDLIFSIMVCVAVSKGERYRYPVCIRFLK